MRIPASLMRLATLLGIFQVALVLAAGAADREGRRSRLLRVTDMDGALIGDVLSLSYQSPELARILVRVADGGRLDVREFEPTWKHVSRVRFEDRGTGWWLEYSIDLPKWVDHLPERSSESHSKWGSWFVGEMAKHGEEPYWTRVSTSNGLEVVTTGAGDETKLASSLLAPFGKDPHDLPPESTRALLRFLVSLEAEGPDQVDYAMERPDLQGLVRFLASGAPEVLPSVKHPHSEVALVEDGGRSKTELPDRRVEAIFAGDVATFSPALNLIDEFDEQEAPPEDAVDSVAPKNPGGEEPAGAAAAPTTPGPPG